MYSLFLIQQIKIETEVNTSTILSTLHGFGDIHCELIFLKKLSAIILLLLTYQGLKLLRHRVALFA
jgi:hypothetical protein